MYSKQRQRAIDDQHKYGDTQVGEYRGVKWHASRCYGGESPPPKRWDVRTAFIYHWCGYITIPAYNKAKESFYKDCFCCSGGSECTYQQDDVFGFDCGHSWDVDCYRPFPYVVEIIHRIIDKLLE